MNPEMAKAANPSITINPMFKLLLWINGALCIITLGIMVWIASYVEEPIPKARERLMNACEHVFTLTAGAFIGLLGGRAAAPDTRRG
jgi:uncharacterized membrane protein YfcA